MRKILIVFALLLVLPCFADDYTEIFNKIYFNNSMFKVDEKTATLNFWLKILNGAKVYPQESYPKDWYVLENWEIHCPETTFSILVRHIYDKKEMPVESDYNVILNERVVPMTLSEIFYKRFCKGFY